MTRRTVIPMIVLATILTGIPMAHATVIVLLDSAALARKSDTIVVGKVTHRASTWSGDRIVTRVTISVERTIEGTPVEELTIAVDGGTVDGVTMKVIGGAEFSSHDRALLFLRRRSDGDLVVTGLAQGKLDVVRGRDGVDRVRWVPPGGRAVRVAALDDVIAALAAATEEAP